MESSVFFRHVLIKLIPKYSTGNEIRETIRTFIPLSLSLRYWTIQLNILATSNKLNSEQNEIEIFPFYKLYNNVLI